MARISGHECPCNFFFLPDIQDVKERSVPAERAPLDQPRPTGSDAEGRGEEFCISKGKMGVLRSPDKVFVA